MVTFEDSGVRSGGRPSVDGVEKVLFNCGVGKVLLDCGVEKVPSNCGVEKMLSNRGVDSTVCSHERGVELFDPVRSVATDELEALCATNGLNEHGSGRTTYGRVMRPPGSRTFEISKACRCFRDLYGLKRVRFFIMLWGNGS